MADVDVSSYKIAPTNPFEQFGRVVGIANALEQNKLLQTHNAATELDLQKNRQGLLGDMLTSLATRPDLNWGHVEETASRAIRELGIPAPLVTSILASWSKDKDNPDALRRNINVALTQGVSRDARPAQVYGAPNVISTGGAQNVTATPVIPGQPMREMGSLPNTMAPGQQVYDPATRTQRVITEGQPGRIVPPGAIPPPQGPLVPKPVPTTRVAPAMGPQMAPAGAPLGEAAAATEAAGSSGKALGEARTAGADYQNQVYPLEQAIPKLEKLGKTGTGPGAEELNHVKSFLQTSGIPGLDAKKIADFDEANKYLKQYVMRSGNTATNEKLFAAIGSSPNTSMSNAAAVDVAKAALALRRMQHGQITDFEQTGLPESQFSSWAAKNNAKYDPRAYAFDLMKPEQRKAILKNLNPVEKVRFMQQVQAAEEQNILRPGGGR